MIDVKYDNDHLALDIKSVNSVFMVDERYVAADYTPAHMDALNWNRSELV